MAPQAELPTTATAASPARSSGAGWPFALPFVRVALTGVAALSTAGVLALAGQPSGLPSVSIFAALFLLPVNIVSFLLVRRLVHRAGSSIRSLIGYGRARLGRDILWGLLWILVLYVPFALAIVGTMFVLFGADAFTSFEAVFAPDPGEIPALGTVASIIFAVVVFVSFAPLNAPTEELVYRGYSQGGLAAYPVIAILAPSFAFGLQHIFFASTVPGMLVYGVAFFVWGIGSALIYRRQGRLMPLIVAHLLVNLATTVPALLLPFVLGG
ncbi:hypothetical protein GCM10022239_13060 [Leifsonia bigeumensis]|uniref:CAAX prenyl protease 2/Lysostaphin resistance protein A-like domain-containing protein n=1 Tax=Leifsonella bigeumensis TaxID=433643 RepID=A0ABP7FI81_9MICO